MWQNKIVLFVESNLLRECVGRSRMKDMTLWMFLFLFTQLWFTISANWWCLPVLHTIHNILVMLCISHNNFKDLMCRGKKLEKPNLKMIFLKWWRNLSLVAVSCCKVLKQNKSLTKMILTKWNSPEKQPDLSVEISTKSL